MSQFVHFQGNPVAVAGQFPQPGEQAKPFRWSRKIWQTCRSLSMQENERF